MQIVKLYTGEDDKSYFEDSEIKTDIQQELGRYSETKKVDGLIFRESEPGQSFDWHNAPQPQYIVYLAGEVEVEASGGETRRFKTGDVLFACDLTGDGHISRVLSRGNALVITVSSNCHK